jgi:hypothetical protein
MESQQIIGAKLLRQQQQTLVHPTDQQPDNEYSCAQRHPDQEPSYQITAQQIHFRVTESGLAGTPAAVAAARFAVLPAIVNIFLFAALEVGFIPTATLEPKSGRRKDFFKRLLLALRALDQ